MSPRRAVLLALLVALPMGCSSTVVRSGLPPGRPAPGYDKHWHAAFLFGAVPHASSYDLSALCPNGWAEIHLAPDEFTFAAGLLTMFLYSPSRLTVICAAAQRGEPPRVGRYLPPGRDEKRQEELMGDSVPIER